MNRRQRKKHHLGEFQQLGFTLRFCTPEGWSEDEQRAFWDACIDTVESLGLALGGGTGICWDVFVAGLRANDTVTPAQRGALLEWLTANPGVSSIEAGELEDAWYPSADPAPRA